MRHLLFLPIIFIALSCKKEEAPTPKVEQTNKNQQVQQTGISQTWTFNRYNRGSYIEYTAPHTLNVVKMVFSKDGTVAFTFRDDVKDGIKPTVHLYTITDSTLQVNGWEQYDSRVMPLKYEGNKVILITGTGSAPETFWYLKTDN